MKNILFFIPVPYNSLATLLYLLLKNIKNQTHGIYIVFGFKDNYDYFVKQNNIKNDSVKVFFIYNSQYNTTVNIQQLNIIYKFKDLIFERLFVIDWDGLYLDKKLFSKLLYIFNNVFLPISHKKYLIFPSNMPCKPYNHYAFNGVIYIDFPSYSFKLYKHSKMRWLKYEYKQKNINIIKKKNNINIFLAPPDICNPFVYINQKLILHTLDSVAKIGKTQLTVYTIKVDYRRKWAEDYSSYAFKVIQLPSNYSIDKLNKILRVMDISFTANFWGLLIHRIVLSGSLCFLINDVILLENIKFTYCETCGEKNINICNVCKNRRIVDYDKKKLCSFFLNRLRNINSEIIKDNKIKHQIMLFKNKLLKPSNKFIHYIEDYIWFFKFYLVQQKEVFIGWHFYNILNPYNTNNNIIELAELFYKKKINNAYQLSYKQYLKQREHIETFDQLLRDK